MEPAITRFLSYVQPPGVFPLLALMLFAAHGLYIFIYFFRCLVTGPRLKDKADYEMFIAYWAVFFVNIIFVALLPWVGVWALVRALDSLEGIAERSWSLYRTIKGA